MDILSLAQWLAHYSIVPVALMFVVVVVVTFLPSRRQEMEHNARIPFEDDR
jgi:cbb3-type cytochrome oxidase subunit 3